MFKPLAISSLTVALAGCANGPLIVPAFDNLTNESTSQRTLLTDYRSFVSISGLAPVHTVGSPFHHPGGVTPGHVIAISPKWSFLTISEYEAGSGAEEGVMAFREQYTTFQELAVERGAQQSTLDLVQRSLKKAAGESASTALDIRKAAAEAMGTQCSAACTDAEVQQAVQEKTKQLKALDDKLGAAKEALDRILKATNAIFTRWGRDTDVGADASAGSVASASASARSGKQGVAVFAGLRVISMNFGEDYLDMARFYAQNLSDRLTIQQVGWVSYEIMAKYVSYFSDEQLQRHIEARLKVDKASVLKLQSLAGLLADQSVDVQGVYAYTADLSNTGKLGKPVVHTQPYCFFPPRIHQHYVEQQINQHSGYSTVFAVKTQPSLLSALFAPASFKTSLENALNQPDNVRTSYVERWKQSSCGAQDFSTLNAIPAAWDGIDRGQAPSADSTNLQRTSAPDRKEQEKLKK